MNATAEIVIQTGLAVEQRQQAAQIYWEAFRRKFGRMPEKQMTALLEEAMEGPLAIVALQENQLVGLAGLQYGGRRFLNWKRNSFVKQFGWARGLLYWFLLLLEGRTQREGQLLMDGLAIEATRRGSGIGTKLLEAVFEFAREKNCATVRLDVIDTNSAAKRLYERMGFVATKTYSYPYLRFLLSFGGSTTMIKPLV